MRILFFSYAYPNAAAPLLGTFNRSLLEALARRHKVRVVSPVSFVEGLRGRVAGRSAFDPRFTAIAGVPAEYLPFYYPPKVLRHRFGDFMWWSVGGRLEQTIREFRPDVILSYWAHPDGDVAGRAGRKYKVPTVVMVGGSDVLLLARSGRRREAILRALRRADAIVAVSQNIAATLQEDGIPASKLHVVRRGLDRNLFYPGDRGQARRELRLDPRRFTMLSVGRLAPVKGHEDLIRAVAELRRDGRELDCYLLGNGPRQGRLQRLIGSLGLDGIVHLAGSKPQTELARWYRAADVTVLPSLSEGVPNVLMESIACGTPFVATDVGGVCEIADAAYDDLVPKGSPSVLAEALRRRMDHPPSPPDHPRRFLPGTWDDSARRLCTVLADVGVPEENSPEINVVEFPSQSWRCSRPVADVGRDPT